VDDDDVLDRIIDLTARLERIDRDRLMFAARDDIDGRVLAYLRRRREQVTDELDRLRESLSGQGGPP
jgi:hypothetical protein